MAAGAELDANATQPMREARVDAKSELGALLPRIPALSIGILGARTGIVVRLNGEVVPEASLGSEMLVNPGVYLINAIEMGASVASERVTLEEGARRAVVLRLPARGEGSDEGDRAKPGRGSAQRVAGWATIGVGAAGLAVGVGAGVHMMNKKAALDEACPDSRCPSSAEGDLESFRAARVASMVGYGVGLAGVGAGVLLLLLTPGEQANAGAVTAPRAMGKNRLKSSAALERPRVTPWVGLGSAGVKGAF
jgi:hypothetical protein